MINPEERVRVAGVTRIEEPDVIEAFRHVPTALSWRLAVGFGLAATAATALFVALLLRDGGSMHAVSEHKVLLILAFVLTCLAIGVVRGKRSVGKRTWVAMPEWQRQVRYEFTDNSLRVRTERSSNELDWGLHEGWLESPTAFYVAQLGQRYIIMPKRAFENESEIAQVRELLRSKVHVPSTLKTRGNTVRRTVVLWAVLLILCFALYQVTSRP